ncbi:hypothetical protein QUD93_05355 [Lactococcus lactis]|nr:hypothetical protein [Lactococcus lactis]MDM7543936.1 hypothetical protein [Lactococcus lactis]
MSKTDKELTAEVVSALFQIQGIRVTNDAIVKLIKDVHGAFKDFED